MTSKPFMINNISVIDFDLPFLDGFHHLALVCRNMDETIKFYEEALGMKLRVCYCEDTVLVAGSLQNSVFSVVQWNVRYIFQALLFDDYIFITLQAIFPMHGLAGAKHCKIFDDFGGYVCKVL